MSRRKFLNSICNVVAVVSMSALCANAYAQPVFAQLSSTKDQIVSADQVNTSMLVKFNNQDTVSDSGISWSSKSPEQITIAKSGAYFVMVSGQFKFAKNAKQTKAGEIALWFEVNGKAIPASADAQLINPGATRALVTQMILSLNAGDVVSVGYSSTVASLGIIGFPATDTRPAVPPIGLSIFKIS